MSKDVRQPCGWAARAPAGKLTESQIQSPNALQVESLDCILSIVEVLQDVPRYMFAPKWFIYLCLGRTIFCSPLFVYDKELILGKIKRKHDHEENIIYLAYKAEKTIVHCKRTWNNVHLRPPSWNVEYSEFFQIDYGGIEKRYMYLLLMHCLVKQLLNFRTVLQLMHQNQEDQHVFFTPPTHRNCFFIKLAPKLRRLAYLFVQKNFRMPYI